MSKNRLIYKEGQRVLGRKEFEAHCNDKNLSATKAIYAFCYECCNGDSNEIKNCLVTDCVLYNHNPYNRKPKRHFKGNAEALKRARENQKKGRMK